MKLTVCSIVFLLFQVTPIFSQDSLACKTDPIASEQKVPHDYFIGIQFGTFQYVGELANEMWRVKQLHGAWGVSLAYEFNTSFNSYLNISHGIIDYYPGETDVDTLNWRFRNSLISIDIGFKLKLNNGFFINESSPVSPFLTLGIGDVISYAAHYEGKSSADFNIPIAWGIDVFVSPKIRLGFFSRFHYTFSDNYDGWDRTKTGADDNLMDRFMFNGFSLNYKI